MKAYAYLDPDGGWTPFCAENRSRARAFLLSEGVADTWLELPAVRRLPGADVHVAGRDGPGWVELTDEQWKALGFVGAGCEQ